MPATKRKASFAASCDVPTKLSKRTSSASISKTITMETKAGTPPSLRRASTMTIEADEQTTSLSKKKSSATKPSSMMRKTSSFVEEGALVTRLSSTKSGSIVGVTSVVPPSATASAGTGKSLSKRVSSIRVWGSDAPLTTGLTKFAMAPGDSTTGSLRISKSALIADVDETEMETALESIKSTMLKKKSSLRKSLSKASSAAKSVGFAATDDDMDTTSTPTDTPAGGAALPPGGLTEVAISFDTTGSMYGCLVEVRAKVQDLVQRLQGDIPGIRISVIAHGDYCDEDSSYLVKWIDFGATLPEICEFVKDVGRTGGGDGPECYELVLKRAREALSWTPGSNRILVIIGDAPPHEPGYTYGGKTYYIDWREESQALKDMGVKIYGVQAGGVSYGLEFYKSISNITGGRHIQLKDFSSMFDFIMMICYREYNPDMITTYEEEMRARSGRLADDVNAFLRSSPPAFGAGISGGFTFGFSSIPRKLETAKRASKPKAKAAGGKAGAAKKPVGKKATKAKTKKIKKKTKPKKDLKKNKVWKREKCTNARLNEGPLKAVTWSKWIKVAVPSMPTTREKNQFIKSRTQVGFTRKTWFKEGMEIPAVYEFAVQRLNKRPRKKYAVYARCTLRGFKRSGAWTTNLLRHKTIRREVDEALNNDCCIWIRRGTVSGDSAEQGKKLQEVKGYMRDHFDYAWKKYVWRKDSAASLKHRLLAQGSVRLSHADI